MRDGLKVQRPLDSPSKVPLTSIFLPNLIGFDPFAFAFSCLGCSARIKGWA
jgi:hypothetical protein